MTCISYKDVESHLAVVDICIYFARSEQCPPMKQQCSIELVNLLMSHAACLLCTCAHYDSCIIQLAT